MELITASNYVLCPQTFPPITNNCKLDIINNKMYIHRLSSQP